MSGGPRTNRRGMELPMRQISAQKRSLIFDIWSQFPALAGKALEQVPQCIVIMPYFTPMGSGGGSEPMVPFGVVNFACAVLAARACDFFPSVP
jgi:hypothetical protein